MMNMKTFISNELFDRLSKTPVKWKYLKEKHIYRVQEFDPNNKIATLIDSTKNVASVYMPENVLKKMESLEKSTVYLKRYGMDAQIVSLNRQVCPDCCNTFASRRTLSNHRKLTCSVSKINNDWYKVPPSVE